MLIIVITIEVDLFFLYLLIFWYSKQKLKCAKKMRNEGQNFLSALCFCLQLVFLSLLCFFRLFFLPVSMAKKFVELFLYVFVVDYFVA